MTEEEIKEIDVFIEESQRLSFCYAEKLLKGGDKEKEVSGDQTG